MLEQRLWPAEMANTAENARTHKQPHTIAVYILRSQTPLSLCAFSSSSVRAWKARMKAAGAPQAGG